MSFGKPQGDYVFIVKKLKKSGNSDTISIYDENDSFRGEARFESKQKAEAYLKLYKERINKHLNDVGKAKTRGVILFVAFSQVLVTFQISLQVDLINAL
jgi:hypothetical protein